MKLLGIAIVAYIPFLVDAYYPFKGMSKGTATNEDGVEATPPPSFNAHQLLNPRARDPDIYNKAILELKALEEKPVCHRVAVQLHMNNCQDLKESGDADYELGESQLQRHHIESFAASLAICDLESGSFDIPRACALFRSPALLRASRDMKGQLKVSPKQVGACMEALGQIDSMWNSWLSYRDKTLLLCRAYRLDIDKDQAILHQKKLTKIMAEFADGLNDYLQKSKENMADHARSVDSYFESVKSHADHLRVKLQHSMKAVTTDFKETASIVKSSLSSTMDLQRMLRNLVEMVIQSTAEIASEQDKALSINTKNTKSQLEGLNNLAVETAVTMAEVRESMLLLMPVIQSLSERQDALDKKSETLYSVLTKMANMVQNHTEDLEQASFAAFKIHETLENASAAAKSWKEGVSTARSPLDWFLRICGPIAGVLLGGHGLPATLARNVQLLVGGYLSAETIVQLRHLDWQWVPVRPWRSEPLVVKSLIQQAQTVPASTVADSKLAASQSHTDMI